MKVEDVVVLALVPPSEAPLSDVAQQCSLTGREPTCSRDGTQLHEHVHDKVSVTGTGMVRELGGVEAPS